MREWFKLSISTSGLSRDMSEAKKGWRPASTVHQMIFHREDNQESGAVPLWYSNLITRIALPKLLKAIKNPSRISLNLSWLYQNHTENFYKRQYADSNDNDWGWGHGKGIKKIYPDDSKVYPEF